MKLNGLIAAVHTPMHDDFTVDCDRVPAQAEHLAKCGASGAFVTGSKCASDKCKCFIAEVWEAT